MKSVNDIIESINKDKQMTNERVSKVIAAIIEAEDMNDTEMTNENYNKNRIYHRVVKGYDCEVTKWDESIEGFDLVFSVCNGSDNDIVTTLHIESMADLYASVAVIAQFAKNPFKVAKDIEKYNND